MVSLENSWKFKLPSYVLKKRRKSAFVGIRNVRESFLIRLEDKESCTNVPLSKSVPRHACMKNSFGFPANDGHRSDLKRFRIDSIEIH